MTTVYKAILDGFDSHGIFVRPRAVKLFGANKAIMLAQMLYWADRSQDPDGWFYNTQTEYEEQTGLSAKVQLAARKDFKRLGVISEKLTGPDIKLWIRIHPEPLVRLLYPDLANSISTNGRNGSLPLTRIPYRPKGELNKEAETTVRDYTQTQTPVSISSQTPFGDTYGSRLESEFSDSDTDPSSRNHGGAESLDPSTVIVSSQAEDGLTQLGEKDVPGAGRVRAVLGRAARAGPSQRKTPKAPKANTAESVTAQNAQREMFGALALAVYGGHENLTGQTAARIGKGAKQFLEAGYLPGEIAAIAKFQKAEEPWRKLVSVELLLDMAPRWKNQGSGSSLDEDPMEQYRRAGV
jgi:hypothetical protein